MVQNENNKGEFELIDGRLPSSIDEIKIFGKKFRLSTVALVFGILTLLSTYYYAIMALLSPMAIGSGSNHVPTAFFVVMFSLPFLTILSSVLLLIYRHEWKKQLISGSPSKKTKKTLKIFLAIGALFVFLPTLIFVSSVVFGFVSAIFIFFKMLFSVIF